MTVLIQNSVPSVQSLAKSALDGLQFVLAQISAAGAAARAIEVSRQPAEADLVVLGMAGMRFKHY